RRLDAGHEQHGIAQDGVPHFPTQPQVAIAPYRPGAAGTESEVIGYPVDVLGPQAPNLAAHRDNITPGRRPPVLAPQTQPAELIAGIFKLGAYPPAQADQRPFARVVFIV